MTTATRPCIRPAVYQSLMMHLSTDEPLVTMELPDGITFQASYIHTVSGKRVREVTVNIRNATTLYFAASPFAGWYYILQFSTTLNRYGCSCFQGKQGNNCTHVHLIKQEA